MRCDEHRIGRILTLALLLVLCASTFSFGQTTGPWKPELTHRPRLLWEASEWPVILDRLTREPYITLYNRIKSKAGSTPAAMPQYYDASREYGVSNIAKDAAFVWAVEQDAAKGEKAAVILEEQMSVDLNWQNVAGLFKLLDYDIHVAEAMQGYLAAYDILAGTGYLSPARDKAIRDRVETLVVNVWQFYNVDWYLYRNTFNFWNHFTKLAAAFGTAAITLNDSEDATEWINHAMAWGVYKLFTYCSTDEGAYTEGPSYYVYSAVNFLPFFIQYDRFTGGQDATFQKRRCNLFGQDCAYTPVFVQNPLTDPRVAAQARWMTDIRLPDGTSPPFDDSFMIGNINGLLVGPLQDGELAWDWLNAAAAPYYSSYCSDVSVDMISSFDDTVTPTEPERGPSIVYPQDGYAVFRTDWSQGASYALFLAEGGKAMSMGALHEHADTLSFLFWSQGQMLAMDPGYIKYEEHNKVRFGIDHNVVSIDGKGPPASFLYGWPAVDGQIRLYDMDSDPQFAVATTRYANTDWARGLLFYGDFILVGDLLESEDSHDYRFLLHGNGGGDTGGAFAMTESGAHWAIGGVALDLTVTGTGAITPAHFEEEHGWQWGSLNWHEVYSGLIPATQTAGYAAALTAGQAALSVSVTVLNLPEGCGGLEVDDQGQVDFLLVDHGTQNCEVAPDQSLAVESGAAWMRPDAGRVVVWGKNARYSVDDLWTISQVEGISMKIDWDAEGVDIEPDAGEGNTIVVETNVQITSISGTCVDSSYAEIGTTWIQLNDRCVVSVEF